MNNVTSVPGSYGMDEVLRKKSAIGQDVYNTGNILAQINHQ
jgi:hypothetical protein